MTDTRKAAQAVFDAFCASGSIHIDAIKQLGAPMKELGAALAQPEPTLDHVDLARRILTWSGRAISPSREPGADERVDSLAQALADWMPSQPEQQAPVSVNNTMVDAYLKANNAYWHRTDRLPQTPGKWRNGTPYEATRVSLIAALEAAHPPAQPQVATQSTNEIKQLGEETSPQVATISQPEQQAPATLSKEQIGDIVREHLRGLYHCGRVWEAWSVGTMSEDDFSPAEELETADEIADSLLVAMTQRQGAQPEQQAPALSSNQRTKPERFKVVSDGHGIDDDDFIFDAVIRIDGDFKDDATRVAYAQFLCDAMNAAAHPPEQPSEFEVRKDGKTVRKDRWEWGVRRIVALLWGNRHEFEVDEVVDAVAALVPNPHNDGDDETLVASAQVGFAPQPDPQAYGLVLMMRNVRRLQRHMDEWQSWYGAADVLLRNQLPLPPAGTVDLMEDLDESIKAAHPPAQPIEPGNLYWRLHSLSKVLESSGRIDEHEQKGAYATILDAMNHVRSKP